MALIEQPETTVAARSTPAVLLLSGGIDSAVTGALACRQHHALYALTIDYGQRHAVEIAAARRLAGALGVVRHVIQALDLRTFGGSALTDDIAVPPSRAARADACDIPVTYVPARNTIFLSLALAYAETVGAADIYIGVNAVDFSGYPDCRPDFIAAFERMAQLATRAGVTGMALKIHAPLIEMSKADIIRRGAALDVDFALTHSCYDPAPNGRACGRCESCDIRRSGFAEAGVPDPTVYQPAE